MDADSGVACARICVIAVLTVVVRLPALVELDLGILRNAPEVLLRLERARIVGGIARQRAEEVVHTVEWVIVSEEAESEDIVISHKAYRKRIGILVHFEVSVVTVVNIGAGINEVVVRAEQ